MANYLPIIVSAALVNNLVLVQLLGVSSLFYSTSRLQQSIEFALFNFVVLFLSAMANLAAYRLLLTALNLQCLQLLVFVTSSAVITKILLDLLAARLPLSARQQGLALFLTGGNSAVLGASLLTISNVLGIGESIAFSFGAALGYSLLLLLFAALRIRLSYADIPAPFQGTAIQLISAGLVALCLLGFAGVSE